MGYTTYPIMSRLDILKNSLEKKQANFDSRLSAHFADVKTANGQPLNDKRNGASTMRRWDKQNESLSNLQKEIEKTKNAIENEESKLTYICNKKSDMPKDITDLIDNGTLKQWAKYPNILFVEGVDKARIIWDSKKKVVLHKYVTHVVDPEKRKVFAQVYNSLNASINCKK